MPAAWLLLAHRQGVNDLVAAFRRVRKVGLPRVEARSQSALILGTFETLAQRFGLVAPTVVRIGHLIHALDIKESRYATAEAPAIDRMVAGLRRIHSDDHVYSIRAWRVRDVTALLRFH